MEKNIRKAGVLLHPTSLPGKYGIGTLGKAAYAFADKLEEAHVSLWQVLPLGPTGFGDSPYAARSTFAGNELLIDPETLYLEDLLELGDLAGRSFESERVDYGRAREVKMPLLRKAAAKFLEAPTEEYAAFVREKAWWLDDYALYQVLADEYNDSRWFMSWPADIRKRKKSALDKVRKEKAAEIEIWKVMQYFFFRQWNALKSYANEHGIEIIGDIPIFVAPDSVDAWTNTKLLKLDKECMQEASSGVPPDAFSATGQLWGNPLYRWKEHEKTGFEWWISRLRETLKMCDIVRIDHFRGFAACWEVPAGEDTAMNGKWVPSPGQKLLDAFKSALGDDLPIIAEDLGVITEDVEALRYGNGLPGMKILQLAFGFTDDGKFDTTNAYL
ncbi:MAG: 4-alpha-glucanotransferase, partial [Bullifex sp.]